MNAIAIISGGGFPDSTISIANESPLYPALLILAGNLPGLHTLTFQGKSDLYMVITIEDGE